MFFLHLLLAVTASQPGNHPLLTLLLSITGLSGAAMSAKSLRKYKRKMKWKLLWWKVRSAFSRRGSDPSNVGMIFGGILITCIVFGLIFSWAFALVIFLILSGALLAGVSKGR